MTLKQFKTLTPAMILFLALLLFATPQTLAEDSTSETLLPSEVLLLSNESSIATNAFLADKTRRLLYIIQNDDVLHSNPLNSAFDIDIGKNDGNKTKRDDQKTPEGIYLLQEKKVPPNIPFELFGSMAFTTNYPNVFDKFENKTGSGIWLHSIPDEVALNRGSRGCVVLRNDALKKLESSITLNKTFLIINSQIDWLKATEHATRKQAALNWLNSWKNLWEKQDLEKYIQLYSDQFSDPKFNKQTWFAHKKNLKNKYKYVKISTSTPNIFSLQDQFLFQFVQDYESDGHKDRGIKNLYVINDKGTLKILREEWIELKNQTAQLND
ncbi:MAG: hypothetical protein A2622_13000 [Bdellovibrionales bacterium RIFCSPHIGHO2_01_FULL_40_29]|nr:MAG: hypothetical protein A2622_13000 [Bdellovibrionales bacterium RIFCSPHIGHO2_01_FULL_40_29]OFZ33390.1 MAG: hypothetical protein A3D17_13885 [Bdellovibrionales bacterium RIFCSPHIGHO2_02_FULL_40_15]